MKLSTNIKFLQSALASSYGHLSTEEILKWLYDKRMSVKVDIQQTPINQLDKWLYDGVEGRIKHISGKFFSIDGIRVHTNYGLKETWDQPIINQPEIGFLGILTQMKNGVLHFLLQAKIEPGNINVVQLSPTLQATKSNYTRVHQGKTPTFLEYFNGERKVTVLVDQLQSEQGARFFKKRNRNIIIEIPEEEHIEIPDNYIWLTLKQLKDLMSMNNVVNMDTRTVVSAINYGNFDSNTLQNEINAFQTNKIENIYSLIGNGKPLKDIESILSWLTNLKSRYELLVERIPLYTVRDWTFDGNTIYNQQGKYFEVIGTRVHIDNREVTTWDQPMIKPAQEGLIGFIVKKIQGIYHFLVQAKVEIGCFDVLEIAPTVQCLTGNYHENKNEYSVPFIEFFINPEGFKVIHKSLQSEEGGRFFLEQNLNVIIEAPEDFPVELPDNYYWITFQQLMLFMKFNNYLNIATRNLLALLPIEM
ncbi:MAG: NDP-hexose 2,3-dehydratase family protein [Bacteroidales bacterium]|nr:NDP-hexose 2,3-dehydratase family protein [Bacteroidales bacterium]